LFCKKVSGASRARPLTKGSNVRESPSCLGGELRHSRESERRTEAIAGAVRTVGIEAELVDEEDEAQRARPLAVTPPVVLGAREDLPLLTISGQDRGPDDQREAGNRLDREALGIPVERLPERIARAVAELGAPVPEVSSTLLFGQSYADIFLSPINSSFNILFSKLFR